jgi:hypothetical protein
MINLKIMVWAGHIACMGENLKGRDSLEELSTDRRILSEYILKEMPYEVMH